MAEVDAKTRALLDEGLTQGEIDYLNSGGRNTDGLTPPVDEGAAAKPPVEPAASPQEPPVVSSPPLVPGQQPEQDEEAEPSPSDAIPYQRWHRERTRRLDLQRELKARDEAIAAERASTQAERERWARLDERLRVFQQAVEQPQQAPPPEPDPEQDPFAWMKWAKSEISSLKDAGNQVATQVQERDAATELRDTYLQDARQFVSRQPDFGAAYAWIMSNRDAELQAAGYTDPAERQRIIVADERDIVARALMARQQNSSAPGPAQIIYNLAKARGFQTPAAAGHSGNGAATNGKGAAAPPSPSVTQQVEAIQRGQAASRSLSSAGGSPAPTGIDLAKLADMSDTEYMAWKASLSVGQRKELASLLGAPGR